MTTPERLRELAAAPDPRAGLTDLFFVAPGKDVTELLLIRHAQIDVTLQNDDLSLTEIGREQAAALAQYLSRSEMAAIYVSPTARSRETAEPLSRIQTLDIEEVDDLRDVDQYRPLDRPLLELLAEEYGEAEAPAVLAHMQREMTFEAMSGFVESGKAFRARVVAAIDAIIDRHPGETIAVVTHGPVIMSYVAAILDSPRDFLFNVKLTSITRIFAKGDRRTLDYANTTPHFEAI